METKVVDWLDGLNQGRWLCYAKRLSGNDTLANGSHQAGPHLNKEFLFRVFPEIDRRDIKNPDIYFSLEVVSHDDHREVRAIYYNNKFHDNPKSGRNEARITGFGGANSAILDAENTGALAIFAFDVSSTNETPCCEVWICRSSVEEDYIEERIGPIEPGRATSWPTSHTDLFSAPAHSPKSCWLEPDEIPEEWLSKFPAAIEIVQMAVKRRPVLSRAPDERLLSRRDCEFEIFRSVEEAVELPVISAGFTGLEDFISRAQTILQRRKSRSGRSLELHAHQIFIEEKMLEDVHFSHQPETELKKRPDFLFPSEAAYKDDSFPAEKLRMLAVKTTCRDRWRQIVSEADRISTKHLLTLQEGVSENQFHEMAKSGVQLVVPRKLIKSFPKTIRSRIQTFESFIDEAKTLTP